MVPLAGAVVARSVQNRVQSSSNLAINIIQQLACHVVSAYAEELLVSLVNLVNYPEISGWIQLSKIIVPH